MYRKIRNSEDYIMINTNRPLKFIDLRKKQNIECANSDLHDKTQLRGHSHPLKIFKWIYGEVYSADVIRPFQLTLLQ